MTVFARLLTLSLLAISVSAAPGENRVTTSTRRTTSTSTHRTTSTPTPTPTSAPLPPPGGGFSTIQACQLFGKLFTDILGEVSTIAAPVAGVSGPQADIQTALASASFMVVNSFLLSAADFQTLNVISTDIPLIAAAENNAADADTLNHLLPVYNNILRFTGQNCIRGTQIFLPNPVVATGTATSAASAPSPTNTKACKAMAPVFLDIAEVAIPPAQALIDEHHEFGDHSFDWVLAGFQAAPGAAAILASTGNMTSDQYGPLNYGGFCRQLVSIADDQEETLFEYMGFVSDNLNSVFVGAGCVTFLPGPSD